MKNKLLISSLSVICFIISVIFWVFTIIFLVDDKQNMFWYSAIAAYVFSFFAKRLLKIRKNLDIKLS